MNDKGRIALVDAARGILILCMIAFHSLYIAVMFDFSKLDLWSGFWWWFARIAAAGFVLLAGWSYAVQAAPVLQAAPGLQAAPKPYSGMAKRALNLGLIAIAISIVTFFAFGKTGFVFFGVLHLISVCYLIAWPLRNKPKLAALAAALILAAGLYLGRYSFPWPWLSWLGLRPKNLYPADYLPLLPWAAWFLAGIALYPLTKPWLAAARKRRKPAALPVRQLAFLGRHSLVIYLAHLPSLYGIFWLLSALATGIPK